MKLPLSFFVVLSLLVGPEVASAADHSVVKGDGESWEVAIFGKHHHKHHHKRIDCRRECVRRCTNNSRKNVCHRACGTCCRRCHCVPPGTYGNHQACPCYARLRTHGQRLKCP